MAATQSLFSFLNFIDDFNYCELQQKTKFREIQLFNVYVNLRNIKREIIMWSKATYRNADPSSMQCYQHGH